MRIKLTLSYIGDEYAGWQVQPSVRTVQGELQSAIKKLTGEDVSVAGSGRTDAGVHALGQVAHFDLSRDFEVKKVAGGLNYYLPQDIRVLSAKEVGNDFHARYNAKKKTYVYLIASEDNALYLNRAWYKPSLDVEEMKKCLPVLMGKHDFAAFMSSGSEVKTTVREIYDIKLVRRGELLVLRITADGFLYNMVRKIAGVLVKAGEGKLKADDVKKILDSRDAASTPLAPPYALYLYKVVYFRPQSK